MRGFRHRHTVDGRRHVDPVGQLPFPRRSARVAVHRTEAECDRGPPPCGLDGALLELILQVLIPQPGEGCLEPGCVPDTGFPAEYVAGFAVAEILVVTENLNRLSRQERRGRQAGGFAQ